MKDTEKEYEMELDEEIDEIFKEVNGEETREERELEELMDKICQEEGMDEEANAFAEDVCSGGKKRRERRFTVIDGDRKRP